MGGGKSAAGIKKNFFGPKALSVAGKITKHPTNFAFPFSAAPGINKNFSWPKALNAAGINNPSAQQALHFLSPPPQA